jgi:hypothetical protein
MGKKSVYGTLYGDYIVHTVIVYVPVRDVVSALNGSKNGNLFFYKLVLEFQLGNHQRAMTIKLCPTLHCS